MSPQFWHPTGPFLYLEPYDDRNALHRQIAQRPIQLSTVAALGACTAQGHRGMPAAPRNHHQKRGKPLKDRINHLLKLSGDAVPGCVARKHIGKPLSCCRQCGLADLLPWLEISKRRNAVEKSR